MADPQLDELRLTAVALWGFVPEWTPQVQRDILERIDDLKTIPAVFLRVVGTHKNVPGHMMKLGRVMLSRKWDQHVDDELTLMKRQAKVKYDSDLVEIRSAIEIYHGDRKEALEDANFNISDLGRYRISKLYGYPTSRELQIKAELDRLRNPFLSELYDELEGDNARR